MKMLSLPHTSEKTREKICDALINPAFIVAIQPEVNPNLPPHLHPGTTISLHAGHAGIWDFFTSYAFHTVKMMIDTLD